MKESKSSNKVKEVYVSNLKVRRRCWLDSEMIREAVYSFFLQPSRIRSPCSGN